MILIAFLYLVCASSFTISKAALSYVSPLFFTGSRMVLSGIILLGYDYFTNRKRFSLQRQHYLLFGQIVLFYIYFAYVFDIVALKYLTSAKACLLYSLSPFLTALFSYFWFAELMTPKKWVGLFIGFAGFLPVLLAENNEDKIAGTFISWPELMLFGAVLSSVYGWILIRKLVREHDYSSAVINGVGMLGGGVLAFISSFLYEGISPLPIDNVFYFIYYTVFIVIVANIIFSNLYTVLLKKYTATLLSFAGFTAPLFAAVLGWFFLEETISWEFFATTGFVLVGLYLFYQEELRQGYIAKS
jgi:drug/metabolite transporter (DMT)-like permease